MRLAIVTNIITPYRRNFYEEINKVLQREGGELRVFAMTDSLPLRPWTYEDLKSSYTELLPVKKFFLGENDYLVNLSVNKKLRAFNPDKVIIAGSWTYPTIWLMLLHKLKSVKYYFWTESHSVRGFEVTSKNNLIFKFKQYLYNKFDGYCTPGIYANENLNSIVGNHGERVKLPNLVDNKFYEEAISKRENRNTICKLFGLDETKRRFITPARLVSLKGLDLFFLAVAKSKYKDSAEFVLAGDGPEKEKLQEIAKSKKVDIKFLGYCNQNQVRELYACSDVFLLPSLSDANPLTSIEGAFSGLPLCVSKYTGNSPELCKVKENGIIFDTNKPSSIIEAFDFFMEASEEWLASAGNTSLQIAKDGFDCVTESEKFIIQLSQL